MKFIIKKFTKGHVDGVVDKAQLINISKLGYISTAVAFGSEKDETLTSWDRK